MGLLDRFRVASGTSRVKTDNAMTCERCRNRHNCMRREILHIQVLDDHNTCENYEEDI